jgi:hypothetical protein
LLDVGAGRDEQLDHALVSITRCQHKCSPPATELASASDGMPAISLGAWPYPSLAAPSTLAAMSCSTGLECPPPAASVSAVRPRLTRDIESGGRETSGTKLLRGRHRATTPRKLARGSIEIASLFRM